MLNLSFLLFFILAAGVNFLTLYLVAKLKKAPIKKILVNPAFVFGDFLLIPAYFALLASFLWENPSILGGFLILGMFFPKKL